MDPREARSILKPLWHKAKIDDSHIKIALVEAIKALDKQISMKVLVNDWGLDCCPNCHGVEVLAGCESIKLNRCNDCGQKLDWEDE